MNARFLSGIEWALLSSVTGMVLGVASMATLAAPESEAMPVAEAQPVIPLVEFMDLNVIEPSEEVQQLIQDLITGVEGSGSSTYAVAKRPEFLSIHEAVNRALQKNLSLAVTQKNIPFSDEALLEAEAVFDPVFDVSVSYTRNNTSERRIIGFVEEKNFLPFGATAGFADIPINPNLNVPQVDGLQFTQFIGRGTVLKPVTVSTRPSNDTPDNVGYTVSVQQQLPWGVSFDVTLNMLDKRVFYNGRGNSYGANWTSNISGNLVLPLPYTKNFGPYSPVDVGIKFAAKDTEASFWILKQAINEILRATDALYWGLVFQLERLKVVNDNRQLIEQQVEATERLFEAKRITAFDKAQVDAELERLKVEEESVRALVIGAANALATFVTDSSEEIAPLLLIPVQYQDHLKHSLNLDDTDVFANGLEHQPVLRVAQVDIESAGINREFNRVQTLPDVTFFASGNARQKAEGVAQPSPFATPTDGFGYEGPEDSLAHLFEPDSFGYSTTLAFLRPWGNRALEARYEQAQHGYAVSELNLRAQRNGVRKQIGDALSSVYTARERVALTQKNVEYAELALEKLISRRDKIGDVTALEVVRTSQTLLDARTELVDALVTHKLAEGELLAAQGIIANQYAQNLARSDFERNRLGMLAANDGLRFFAPIAE